MKNLSFSLLPGLIFSGLCFAGDRPNILWLSCEDISPHIGCFGDENAMTPHLDKLAEQGVRYTHVFTAAGVCAPCRSTIITGMHQTTIGTHHMRCRATLPDFIKPFPVYLREAGYYCTNNSKTDYQFKHPKETWDASSSKAHWRNRPDPKQPFFAVFNFGGCHESGIASESKYRSVTARLTPEQRQEPSALTLPPYYPDTRVVREDWKRNYELITAMDAWVGQKLAELNEVGLAENTIVMFWSDHGVGLPRAKRWLYDSGTRVPFILRLPKKFRVDGQGKPGVQTDELVSSLDFGPTVLKLAGLDVPTHMQGRAFLGTDLTPPHEVVFGCRDRMDERYDIIRSVRDKRWRYIRNYEPLRPYYQYMNTPEKGATMREIRRLEKEGGLPAAAQLFSAPRKPVEELYDLQADPYEVNNLADDPKFAGELKRLREIHMQWVRDTKDIGLIPETELERRVKEAGSEYELLRQPGQESLGAELGAIAALASDGVEALPKLREGMRHKDAAIRYWAATGVGNIGDEAKLALADVQALARDESPAVRIAAARALAALGKITEALPILEAELEGQLQWGRLQAAIVLDEMDEAARPALPAMQKALKNKKQPNKYIWRVVNRAVNELEGTSHTVP